MWLFLMPCLEKLAPLVFNGVAAKLGLSAIFQNTLNCIVTKIYLSSNCSSAYFYRFSNNTKIVKILNAIQNKHVLFLLVSSTIAVTIYFHVYCKEICIQYLNNCITYHVYLQYYNIFADYFGNILCIYYLFQNSSLRRNFMLLYHLK